MRHRIALAILVALVLSPALVAAQPPRDASDFERGGRSEQRQAERIQKMIEFLDLSDAQALEIESILTEQRDARREAFASMRSKQEELQALLEAETPDPARVGSKAIELHRIRQSARSQGEQDLAAIRDLLTPEQAEKFDTMLEVREMGRARGERERGGRRGPRGRRAAPPTSDG